jgi:hypothetical protein
MCFCDTCPKTRSLDKNDNVAVGKAKASSTVICPSPKGFSQKSQTGLRNHSRYILV